MVFCLRRRDGLPGLSISIAFTLVWIGLIVVLPLTALVLRPWQDGGAVMLRVLHDGRMYAALRVSFSCAALAALIDVPLGLLLAWALVRARLPGRRAVDALIDLPFALPTAVTGITLATLYGPTGWIGALLARAGIRVAYTPAGIVVALMFVGLPFIVRAVEPVLRGLPPELEEAGLLLGASPWQNFRRVILPPLLPPLVAGFSLAFARCIGEYGSVIFIAGNQPFHSEIAPLLIVVRLQEFDYEGATAIALILLLSALICMTGVAALRRRVSRGLVARGAA
ncbi:sulfate ABC transporter permease [Gluconacetobacter liquefaciens]|uniref:Sulfate transport system permease protein CysT n=1 Tax=Gluconacetobacter liquefaciens TaxID=89584 RepID=A0A370G897_GLULI|nr:sulfate ABC transporter permease subunit CysT [Gluconacetobacter liquefaciens]MBB2185634.1 sulfate ABC transporter permease subunit CysT [Gluconacetobacter liquefaciens]RDI39440.1 sulfate transport system permease protein [Gluconacetobacter liquefaciens]GBQ94317.1 sulfate transporter permease CysT [Gluconacetobacter liquefaciens NRIC 0522]GEB36081.1 sulfate ABC transporter permease [Gluconacetobacter liquefaciens]